MSDHLASPILEIRHRETEEASLVINGTRYRASRFRNQDKPGRPWTGWSLSRFGGKRYTYVRSQPREGFATLDDVIAYAEERWP